MNISFNYKFKSVLSVQSVGGKLNLLIDLKDINLAINIIRTVNEHIF